MRPLNFDHELPETERSEDTDMAVDAEIAHELNAMMNYCDEADIPYED